MEQIDNAWMDKQLTQMVGNNPDELEDLQFIMNYLLSLAKNVAFEKISQLKSDQLLQVNSASNKNIKLKDSFLDSYETGEIEGGRIRSSYCTTDNSTCRATH
jgi:hypothetical protein